MLRSSAISLLVFFSIFNGTSQCGQKTSENNAKAGRLSALHQSQRDHFDIRDKVRAHASSQRTLTYASKSLAQRAKAAAEASGLSPEGATSELQVSVGTFGWPKLISSPEGTLTKPSQDAPEAIARGLLHAYRTLLPFSDSDIDNLHLTMLDHSGGLTYVTLQQSFGGIDVIQGAVKVVLDSQGRVIQTGVGDVVAGLRLSTQPKLTPLEAVNRALTGLNRKPIAGLQRLPGAAAKPALYRNPYGRQYLPVAVDLAIFPLTPNVARLAYRIILELNGSSSYELLVDAQNGALLHRQSLVRHAAQARVWKDSPLKGARELVTFPDGWLPETALVTTGNNADAYLDTDGDDTPDSKTVADTQNGRAFSPSRVFDFPAGEGSTGQDPSAFAAAAVSNAFYFANEAHDYFYNMGFNEVTGNYQTDNLGRGGRGNDAMRVEVHDGEATASISVTPDGMAPRLHLGITTRDRDVAYSAQMIVHEYTHGLATRIYNSPSCLIGYQSGALDEGWADYFAISYTNDPVFDAYLSTDKLRGSRRLSYDRYLYTYEDLGNEGFNHFNDGEIWAATLWDLRKELGQKVTDQLVFDGLRLTPCNPSIIDARDAILRADLTKNSNANRAKLWQVFARHGLGNSATGADGNIFESTVFTAASDLPTDLQTGNRTPKVTTKPVTVPGLGDAFTYDIDATDGDGDTLRFELTEGPPGMTVDAQTGLVKWTASFVGQRAKVTITDGKGGKAVHGFTIPVVTRLNAEQRVTIGGTEDSMGIAEFTVPSGAQIIQTTLRGGIGNADLGLITPDASEYYLSVESASTETLSASMPSPGVWTILVIGGSTYSGVSLQASLPVPKLIEANTTSQISGEATSQAFYRVVVPAGATALTVATSGGEGDLDLYVKKDQPATCSFILDLLDQCTYDRASTAFASDNVEFIQIQNPGVGDWYIAVTAETAFTGARLRTAVTTTGQTAPKAPPAGRTLASTVVQTFSAAAVSDAKLLDSPRFRIEVPEGAPGLTVNLVTTTAGADVDLFLRYESPVVQDGTNIISDHSSRQQGTGNESIVVTPSSTPPLRAGWYSVALRLATPGVAVQGRITATLGAPASGPRILPGGIVLATGTPVVSRLSPNSSFTIFGDALAPVGTSALSPALDASGRISTNLANTCVEINGVRTPLFVVLPTQINGQTPEGLAAGTASVVVIRGCGTSAESRTAVEPVTISATSPGFFHFINNQNGKNPIAALHGGGPELAAAVGSIPGAQSTPATQGEFVSLFATGLGATSPSLKAGEVPATVLRETGGQARVAGQLGISIGGIQLTPEDIYYAGTAPCCAGLYQLVVKVPAAAANGDLPVVVSVDGVSSPQGSYLSVKAPQ